MNALVKLVIAPLRNESRQYLPKTFVKTLVCREKRARSRCENKIEVIFAQIWTIRTEAFKPFKSSGSSPQKVCHPVDSTCRWLGATSCPPPGNSVTRSDGVASKVKGSKQHVWNLFEQTNNQMVSLRF